MAPSHFDRRRGDRRRGSRGAYAGTERRISRDRRRSDGRRGYDDEDEREGYYYAGQKKQQNPMVYFGIAGGAILLIIIIAVAASGSSSSKRKDKGHAPDYRGVEEMEKRASDLVMQGGEAMRVGENVLRESGQSAADPHLGEAYNYFQQAHDLYEELDRRFPNTRFYHALQDLERNMYEVQRKRGTGG